VGGGRTVRVRTHIIAGIAVGIAIGTVMGLGGYTFLYAKGSSYLTDNPAACANCHIMQEQYDGWIKASHRSVAVCNDCHTPEGFLAKYATKALNGFWHSFAFTTGRFPEPLRIGTRNRAISEQACRSCHGDIVDAIEAPHIHATTLACIRCHSEVGHY
jgi:cytochrome c nitrite reductase small subunit